MIIASLFMLFSTVSNADDWLCKSQATQREGSTFHSCGVAWAKDENQSRLQALENAKKEFAAICSASDDCAGKSIEANPGRTDCAPELNGVRCYRSVVFSVGSNVNFPKGRNSPYLGKSLSAPTISKGMTKADLLAKFGAPNMISQYGGQSMAFAYSGEMCVFKTMNCWVNLDDGRVSSFRDFKPEYTDLLN